MHWYIYIYVKSTYDIYVSLVSLHSGVHNPTVRKDRQLLFEEFVQSGEDWMRSSIVINSQSKEGQNQQGIYKLMSREESCFQHMYMGSNHLKFLCI